MAGKTRRNRSASDHRRESREPDSDADRVLRNALKLNRLLSHDFGREPAKLEGVRLIRGRRKDIYYLGMAQQLSDLEADPTVGVDLGESVAHAGVLAELEVELRRSSGASQAARIRRQAAMLARHGGKDEILKRRNDGYSPAPGE